jgi:hypothetical protein
MNGLVLQHFRPLLEMLFSALSISNLRRFCKGNLRQKPARLRFFVRNFSKETLPFSQSRRNCARTGKKHSSSSKVPLHFLATVPKMQEAVLRRMYERFFYECKAQ